MLAAICASVGDIKNVGCYAKRDIVQNLNLISMIDVCSFSACKLPHKRNFTPFSEVNDLNSTHEMSNFYTDMLQ